MKKDMLAMILAGGQGSRLGVFTKRIAKPAVSFGGKYRIIDFVLSNCSNSGIDTVGVLTQYRPLILNSHIGTGSHWDLDRINGGVHILQPYMNEKEGNWYRGTAHAIHQNMDFIDSYNPEYVLILSGDHIYKMDYSKMLDHHKKMGSKATIGVIEVPWDEASRFGIMNTNEDSSIYEFEEKPANPKSNYAVPGLYFYTNEVIEIAKNVKPSARGELEITSINEEYMKRRQLKVEKLGRGMTWFDTGTHDALIETASFVQTIQKRQGLQICCPEEIAFDKGWINSEQLSNLAQKYMKTDYGKYLKDVADNVFGEE